MGRSQHLSFRGSHLFFPLNTSFLWLGTYIPLHLYSTPLLPLHIPMVYLFLCVSEVLHWTGLVIRTFLTIISVLQRTVESTASQTWEEFWLENNRRRLEFNETFVLDKQFSKDSSRIHAGNPSSGTLCWGDEQSSFHCVLVWLSDSSLRSGCLSLPAYYASCG